MTTSEVSENIGILSLIEFNKFVWNSMQCFNIQKIVNYKSVSLSLYFLVCSVYSCNLKRFVMNKFLEKVYVSVGARTVFDNDNTITDFQRYLRAFRAQ